MKEIDRIAVIGSGSWGSAIADMLARKGKSVFLFIRDRELYKEILYTGVNSKYLKGVRLSENITPVNDIGIVKHVDSVIIAVPVRFMRGVLLQMKDYISPEHVIISVSKGMEYKTSLTPLGIVRDVISHGSDRSAVLSGPNFALEIAKQLPAAAVVASWNEALARDVASLFFQRHYYRVYTSTDVIGVELGGALKNIIAITSGISDGLRYGDNARASLITRGLFEMMKFGVFMGARRETFMGLAGLGDLILTCTGRLSRNRAVGLRIAHGEKLEDILASMVMVPEGVYTVRSVFELSVKYSIDMPITRETYLVLYENKDPYDSLNELMKRPIKQETYDIA